MKLFGSRKNAEFARKKPKRTGRMPRWARIVLIVFEPWHWRYVGVENALAIRASGLSLEEFIALQRAD